MYHLELTAESYDVIKNDIEDSHLIYYFSKEERGELKIRLK
jgi:hypothetical protein